MKVIIIIPTLNESGNINIIYNKLKTFNKHQCFGENLKDSSEALKSICLFGDPDQVKDKVFKNTGINLELEIQIIGKN